MQSDVIKIHGTMNIFHPFGINRFISYNVRKKNLFYDTQQQ